jgi:hypothetical protein
MTAAAHTTPAMLLRRRARSGQDAGLANVYAGNQPGGVGDELVNTPTCPLAAEAGL